MHVFLRVRENSEGEEEKDIPRYGDDMSWGDEK
jgi:hypothetical protein